ncbi:MAG: GDSL-type esterase/lipase family protein [Patescibacteria group bacterium]
MRLIFLLLAGSVSVFVAYGVFFADDYSKGVKNYPSTGTEIIAFGDSLIAGEGATAGNDLVSTIGRQLGQPIVNLGKSGDTTETALARLPSVLARDPKVVIVLLGGNDYLRRVPLEVTFANLETIVTNIQDAGAIVVVLGVRGGILTDDYKKQFDLLTKKYHTAYVPDVLSGVIAHPELMHDTIHPNDAGYAKIADRVYPVIEELIH